MRHPLVWLLAGGLAYAGEFPTVMAEQNLEKRSEVALQHADTVLTSAKQAYDAQKLEDFRARIADVVELAELSYKSLQDSGKRARRSPKYFKRADSRLRALMRRLNGLAQEVSHEERGVVSKAHARVNEVLDQVVHDIMTKR
jgi:hypothetical protein